MSQEKKNDNNNTAQIVYHALSEQIDHSTVNFTYANDEMLKSQKMVYKGNLPTAKDEILVQESFLNSLGYTDELGQIIKIPFSDGSVHNFRIDG